MTETWGELIDRGWDTGPMDMDDASRIYATRCKEHRDGTTCNGHLVPEAWYKEGQPPKIFTRCLNCRNRKEF